MEVRTGDHTPATHRLQIARNHYETWRLLLNVLLVIIVLSSLVLILLQSHKNGEQIKQNAMLSRQVQALLIQQDAIAKENLTSRAKAVADLVEAQRRQLAQHDVSTKRYLSQIRTLSRVEVYGAKNQEGQPIRTIFTTRFIGPIAQGTTRTTIRYVAPAPAPSPTCTKRGKRCR